MVMRDSHSSMHPSAEEHNEPYICQWQRKGWKCERLQPVDLLLSRGYAKQHELKPKTRCARSHASMLSAYFTPPTASSLKLKSGNPSNTCRWHTEPAALNFVSCSHPHQPKKQAVVDHSPPQWSLPSRTPLLTSRSSQSEAQTLSQTYLTGLW